jgi:parvulin-like peptidyl-prolyl isomerase
MSAVLQINDRAIAPNDIIPLLSQYQLLPQLMRELIVDQAIAPIECTEDEIHSIQEAIAAAESPLPSFAQEAAVRSLKIQRFKEMQWQAKVQSYFLQRKGQLDQVIYSLIRTQDVGIADELYFRIQNGEQSFSELASLYSEGPEARTGGLIGPVEVGSYHPSFAHLLSTLPLKQVVSPRQLDQWFVILRLEKYIPAQLDDTIRQRLLNELFEVWMSDQLAQVQCID